MVYTIYKIVNEINNKVYVGFTSNFQKRVRDHKSASRCNTTKALYRAFQKYGIDAFVFEEIYQTKDRQHALNDMEPLFIEMYEAFGVKGYNMNPGGGNTNTPDRVEAARQRMMRNNPMHTLKTNRGSFKPGHVPNITAERNAKISASKRGAQNPNYGREGNAARLNVRVYCETCGKSTNKGNFARWHQH
jgi:group I intron endonuclease